MKRFQKILNTRLYRLMQRSLIWAFEASIPPKAKPYFNIIIRQVSSTTSAFSAGFCFTLLMANAGEARAFGRCVLWSSQHNQRHASHPDHTRLQRGLSSTSYRRTAFCGTRLPWHSKSLCRNPARCLTSCSTLRNCGREFVYV